MHSPQNLDAAPGLPDGIFFEPKIPIWVNFVAPQNRKCLWSLGVGIIQPFGIFYGNF
jgi:hypothetical protein